jgi:hypothetical protein
MSDRIGHAPVLLRFRSGRASTSELEELVSNRILLLLLRSCQIADAIEAEQRRDAPSVLRLLRLKRLRLLLTTRLQAVLGGLLVLPTMQPSRLSVRTRVASTALRGDELARAWSNADAGRA